MNKHPLNRHDRQEEELNHRDTENTERNQRSFPFNLALSTFNFHGRRSDHREWCRGGSRTLMVVCLLLAACGLVEVQVEPIPTPVPTDVPIAPPPGSPSAGLVANSAPDDDRKIIRTVAAPHLVFAPENTLVAEMLPQWANPTEYLVGNSGYGFRMRAEWNALWLTDTYGRGFIELAVDWKPPQASDFEPAQYAATEEFEAWGADERSELLDATIYLEQPGIYELRATTRVTMTAEDGTQVPGESLYETRLVVLNRPGSFPSDPSDYVPAFGELESQGILLDWRGWRRGPCFVETDGNVEANRQLDEACIAFEGGDWGQAMDDLQRALDMAGENTVLQNRIRQQMGILAGASDQWNVAVRNFRAALAAAQSSDDAFEVALALRNLGVALRQAELNDEGDFYLFQAIQVFDQLEDWLGSALGWGQFGVYWDSPDTLEWVAGVLSDNGLPQGDLIWGWIEELQNEAG